MCVFSPVKLIFSFAVNTNSLYYKERSVNNVLGNNGSLL